MTTVSDPATQLHAMCTIVAGLSTPRKNDKGSVALASLLETEESSSDYFMGIGAIAARFDRVQRLLDGILEEPHKSLMRQTLASLQSFLSAGNQMIYWSSVRDQVFTQANMQTLMAVSVYVRQHAPIGVPTQEERDNAILLIDDALLALADQHGPLSASIYAALQSTKRMMAKFDIYGVDSITEELLKAFALRSASEADQTASATEKKSWNKAWTAFVVVAGFFVASDAAITSVENHFGRAQTVMSHFASQQKRLPAPVLDVGSPAAILPNEREDDDTAPESIEERSNL